MATARRTRLQRLITTGSTLVPILGAVGCGVRGDDVATVGVKQTANTITGELPFVDPPEPHLMDACREGAKIFGPQRITRGRVSATDETFTFAIPEGRAACVTVVTGDDGEHRATSAKIWVDGDLIIGPLRFARHIYDLEQPLAIDAGAHTLRVRMRGEKHTYLDVSVRAGQTNDRYGISQSTHLEVFNLHPDPNPFSPALGSTTVTAFGTAWWPDLDDHDTDSGGGEDGAGARGNRGHREDGNNGDTGGDNRGGLGHGGNDRRDARSNDDHQTSEKPGFGRGGGQDAVPGRGKHHGWGWWKKHYVLRSCLEVRSAACDLVRTICSEHDILPPNRFALSTDWDGTDDAGQVVADGSYAVRYVVSLVKRRRWSEQVVDSVATGQIAVLADATGPVVQIESPEDGSLLPTTAVPFEIPIMDQGTGIDPTTVALLVDSTDRASDLTWSGDRLAGVLSLGGGSHTAHASAADLAGNVGTSAVVEFSVDAEPPVLTITTPADGEVLEFPLATVTGTVTDASPVTVQVASGVVTVDALIAGNDYAAVLEPLEFGLNLIVVTATDVGGNSSTDSVAILVSDADAAGVVTADEGGRIEVTDEESRLFGTFVDVPPGAVADYAGITIDESPSSTTCSAAGVSPAVKIKASGTFVSTVTVGIPFSPSAVAFLRASLPRVRLSSTPDDGGPCVIHANSHVEPSSNLVVSDVGSFSVREFGHYRLSGSDQLHHLFAYSSPPGTSSSV